MPTTARASAASSTCGSAGMTMRGGSTTPRWPRSTRRGPASAWRARSGRPAGSTTPGGRCRPCSPSCPAMPTPATCSARSSASRASSAPRSRPTVGRRRSRPATSPACSAPARWASTSARMRRRCRRWRSSPGSARSRRCSTPTCWRCSASCISMPTTGAACSMRSSSWHAGASAIRRHCACAASTTCCGHCATWPTAGHPRPGCSRPGCRPRSTAPTWTSRPPAMRSACGRASTSAALPPTTTDLSRFRRSPHASASRRGRPGCWSPLPMAAGPSPASCARRSRRSRRWPGRRPRPGTAARRATRCWR